MLIDPRHLVVVGALLIAGAVTATALTRAADRHRMAALCAELTALDTMALEPAHKAEIRSNLGYHLAGLDRSAAARLTGAG